jgi:tetratricopeptide (TPR) repeat protein
MWFRIAVAGGVLAGLLTGDPDKRDAPDATADPARAAALRAKGVEAGFNLDHDEAMATFKAAIAADPVSPAGYRLAAAAAWTAILFERGAVTVDDYLGAARASGARPAPVARFDAAFHDYIERALAQSEQRVRQHPEDPDAHFDAGAAFGLLACYIGTVEGSLLRSMGPGRRAYKEHERLLRLDPARQDAGLIVGLYRYVVSVLPMPARMMARLMGFDSDRAEGLRLVEAAASHEGENQPSALFMLVLLYNREGRYDDALKTIDGLQRQFPRNRLLWLEAGATALRAGRPGQAKALLDEGLARLARDPRPRAPGEDARWKAARDAALRALGDKKPEE